ncbi:MAG: 4Fe-4S binding protein [Candidatus Bathyarchaeales archaeon]
MITYYGYMNGSGEYYIAVDSEKCNGCGECVRHCPQMALEIATIMVDVEEQHVAAVKEEHRKKIKYTCAPCKPDEKPPPCVSSCKPKALMCIWKSRSSKSGKA